MHVKKHTFWASPQSGVHGAFLADGACGRSRGGATRLKSPHSEGQEQLDL